MHSRETFYTVIKMADNTKYYSINKLRIREQAQIGLMTNQTNLVRQNHRIDSQNRIKKTDKQTR